MASLVRIDGVLGFAACLFAFAAQAQDVVSLDPVFDQLVAPDAKVEVVKGGFGKVQAGELKTATARQSCLSRSGSQE